LKKGSELLRVVTWQKIPINQLKTLIRKFAIREAGNLRVGRPEFGLWRVRRLRVMNMYEKRFGCVPDLFKRRKMPVLKSYYVINGEYIWPTQQIAYKV
jgi:hypothetical protein